MHNYTYRDDTLGGNTYWRLRGKYRPRVPYYVGYHAPIPDPSGVLANAPTFLNGTPPLTARHAGQKVVRNRQIYGHPLTVPTPAQPPSP